MAWHSARLLDVVWLASVLVGAATAAVAQDWKLIEKYVRIDGYLGDRGADSTTYENWEIYDERTAKFYSVFPLDLTEELAVMVDVYSYDFQPAITVHDMAHNVIGRSTIMDPIYQTNGIAYHARLEFYTPWTGPAELLISSEVPDQGNFAMEWSLWGPDAPAATGSSPLPPGTSECDCQDQASGRYYQSPFEDLGECIPERAIKWCN